MQHQRTRQQTMGSRDRRNNNAQANLPIPSSGRTRQGWGDGLGIHPSVGSGDSARAVEAAANAQNCTWVMELTAATLAALHPTCSELATDKTESTSTGTSTLLSKQQWIQSWVEGGWATHGSDLGPPETQFGSKCTTGSVRTTMPTNVYAKFRLHCHSAIHRAAVGLAFLTKTATEEECGEAQARRGKFYRSMR